MKFAMRCLLAVLAGAILHSAPVRAAGGEGLPSAPVLSVEDCAKCHEQELVDLQEEGGAHTTAVTCIDCHQGHPPRSLEVIPACSNCHQGNDHVEWQGPCLACHTNPHRPLRLTLATDALAACLGCHPDVGEDFTAEPSMHARFHCTACHRRHGIAYPCGECHLPHAGGREPQACADCHSPHKPLAVAFSSGVDSAICASCHAEIDKRLQSGGGAHREVGCAGCHAGRHGEIPVCATCHTEPHPAAMLARFSGCGDCHQDVHAVRK